MEEINKIRLDTYLNKKIFDPKNITQEFYKKSIKNP